jgi:hypothetical protein
MPEASAIVAQLRMLAGAGDQPEDAARAVGADVQLGAQPAAPLAARWALQVVLS